MSIAGRPDYKATVSGGCCGSLTRPPVRMSTADECAYFRGMAQLCEERGYHHLARWYEMAGREIQ